MWQTKPVFASSLLLFRKLYSSSYVLFWGAWNWANSLPDGSFCFPHKLLISQDPFKQSIGIATVLKFQVYNCHGIPLPLQSQVICNWYKDLVKTFIAMVVAHPHFLFQIDVTPIWVGCNNLTVSLQWQTVFKVFQHLRWCCGCKGHDWYSWKKRFKSWQVFKVLPEIFTPKLQ